MFLSAKFFFLGSNRLVWRPKSNPLIFFCAKQNGWVHVKIYLRRSLRVGLRDDLWVGLRNCFPKANFKKLTLLFEINIASGFWIFILSYGLTLVKGFCATNQVFYSSKCFFFWFFNLENGLVLCFLFDFDFTKKWKRFRHWNQNRIFRFFKNGKPYVTFLLLWFLCRRPFLFFSRKLNCCCLLFCALRCAVSIPLLAASF